MEIGGSGTHSARLVADGSCWLVTSGFQDARAQCYQHFNQHWTLAVAAVGYVLGTLAGTARTSFLTSSSVETSCLGSYVSERSFERSFEEAPLCKLISLRKTISV